MSALAVLPPPSEVRVIGRGNARRIRYLYAERCSPCEIAAMLNVTVQAVSQALRWKAGADPLIARRAA